MECGCGGRDGRLVEGRSDGGTHGLAGDGGKGRRPDRAVRLLVLHVVGGAARDMREGQGLGQGHALHLGRWMKGGRSSWGSGLGRRQLGGGMEGRGGLRLRCGQEGWKVNQGPVWKTPTPSTRWSRVPHIPHGCVTLWIRRTHRDGGSKARDRSFAATRPAPLGALGVSPVPTDDQQLFDVVQDTVKGGGWCLGHRRSWRKSVRQDGCMGGMRLLPAGKAG